MCIIHIILVSMRNLFHAHSIPPSQQPQIRCLIIMLNSNRRPLHTPQNFRGDDHKKMTRTSLEGVDHRSNRTIWRSNVHCTFSGLAIIVHDFFKLLVARTNIRKTGQHPTSKNPLLLCFKILGLFPPAAESPL